MECRGEQRSMDACSEGMWLWRAPQPSTEQACVHGGASCDVVQCAKKTFSLAILWGGIWTQEA